MVVCMPPPASTFRIPDLFSHCPFPLTFQKNGEAISRASAKWIEAQCPEFDDKQRKKLYGIKAGELSAYCWPYTDDEHLRVISDFTTFLFHLDDISDGMMTSDTKVLADTVLNALWFPDAYRPTCTKGKEQPDEEIAAGKLARSFWSRCIKDGGPNFQARFRENMHRFFEVVNIQARNRDTGIIPDIEAYIDERRDNGGVKLVFDLIEYGLGINLPDFVFDDPAFRAVYHHANDLVSWSNDIFSWNVEQARGDTHNMVFILMKSRGLDLEGAMDYIGMMCREAVYKYCEGRKKIPSWGPEIDKDVIGYLRGLEDWMVGSLHWSFMSERYFGAHGEKIKKTGLVSLLPSKVAQPIAA